MCFAGCFWRIRSTVCACRALPCPLCVTVQCTMYSDGCTVRAVCTVHGRWDMTLQTKWMTGWYRKTRTAADVSSSHFIRVWQAFSVFLHIYKLTCTMCKHVKGSAAKKIEKTDCKHFYLAIRNEMFVHHRWLWSRNCFSANFRAFCWLRAGEHVRQRIRCAKPKHPYFFPLLISHSEVRFRSVQCGTCCSAFDCERAGMFAPMKRQPKRPYWTKLLIRNSVCVCVSRWHSIRFLVAAWLFRSCDSTRKKMASHMNQGKLGSGIDRQANSCPNAELEPISNVLQCSIVVRNFLPCHTEHRPTFGY